MHVLAYGPFQTHCDRTSHTRAEYAPIGRDQQTSDFSGGSTLDLAVIQQGGKDIVRICWLGQIIDRPQFDCCYSGRDVCRSPLA